MTPESIGALIDWASFWWASKRPVGWTVAMHLGNPTINATDLEEKNLSLAVANILKSPAATTPESEQFHREWAEAASKPGYDKQEWIDRQLDLQSQGIPA